MFRSLFRASNRTVVLEISKLLASKNQKDAAKILLTKLLREDPKDKVSRLVYAKVVNNRYLQDDSEEENEDLESSLNSRL